MHRHQQHDEKELRHVVCPVLLPTGRDAALVEQLCRRHDINTFVCETARDLLDAVDAGCGPVIVGDEAFSRSDWAELKDLLCTEPGWSELPLIILSRPRRTAPAPAAIVRRRSTTLLERPTNEATLINVLQADVESRRRQFQVRDLVREQRDLNNQLQMRTRQLQHLTMALTRAEENERKRVANTLHDGLQQLLAAARVTVSRLAVGEENEERQEAVRDLDDILADAIDSSRTLAYDLSPPLLHHAGLGPALDQLADSMASSHDLDVRVRYDRDAPKIDEHLRIFLFEAARELLFNAYKHANTTAASVGLSVAEKTVRLTVSDQGSGFDPAMLEHAEEAGPNGFGLFGVRERARLLGGTFEAISHPGDGTEITIELPRVLPKKGEAVSENDSADADQTQAPPRDKDHPLRVLVADDHQVMRNGLVSLLSGVANLEIVGEAGDGVTALEQSRKLRPDVIVMDVSMPGLSGVEVTRRIRQEMPQTQVVGLSMFEEAKVADEMLEAGASAYLVKSGPTEGLIHSILACRNHHDSETEFRQTQTA